MKMFITLIMLVSLTVPALAGTSALPSVPEKIRAEQQALAELVTARLKAALEGEAFTVKNDCTSQKDCAVTLSRSE